MAISGAKSDAGDAQADMVRTDGHQLRTIAGDSDTAAAVKVVARAHKTLVWERTWHMLRLRHALRDFFPAALEAFEDLTAPDALELLTKAPDPTAAARLTTGQITAALRRAHRRNIETKAAAIRVALRTPHLGQPAAVTAAYAAVVRSQAAILGALRTEITTLQVSAPSAPQPAKFLPARPRRGADRRLGQGSQTPSGHKGEPEGQSRAPVPWRST